MFKTLRSALFAAFIFIIFLVLVIFTSLSLPRIKTSAVDQISQGLDRQIALSKDRVSSLLQGGVSSRKLQLSIIKIAEQSGSRITVIDKRGRVLADSATSFEKLKDLDNHLARPEIKLGQSVRYSSTVKKDFIYVVIELDKNLGYLRFSVPLTYAEKIVVDIERAILAAIVIAIILAVIFSLVLSRIFSDPVANLALAAKNIAEGNFLQRFKSRSKFEVGDLEESIEKMGERLDETFKKLTREAKYRSEFVANVSHELKTPLTAIRNYVETLIAGAIDDKEHNILFLKKIEKHSFNLSQLIEDILEIYRLESKKEIEDFEKVHLSDIVNQAIDAVSDKARKKEIGLSKDFEYDDIHVQGVSDQIYRAVINLLDNAINYTDHGGRVEVAVVRFDDRAEIIVKDNGIGISKEDIPRIFERFYRVKKVGGTGLGLSIVKHIMNIHHGSVFVESELGQGSKFILQFFNNSFIKS